MRTRPGLNTALAITVALGVALVSAVALANVKLRMDGLSYESAVLAGGERSYTVSEGTGTMTNEKGEVIAQGKLGDQDGFIALRGKSGTAFEFEPSSKPISSVKWSNKKASSFSSIAFDGKKTWSLHDDNLVFLIEASSSPKAGVHLDETLARASAITLPKGEFVMWGYKIRAKRDGATVTFSYGTGTSGSDCDVSQLKGEGEAK